MSQSHQQSWEILVDARQPDGWSWHVEREGATFYFFGPHSPFLFTSVGASDVESAAVKARKVWAAIPTARRNRWYSPQGAHATFDWSKCPKYVKGNN